MAAVTPQAALQIQRILLEGFTNILKHAQAARVVLSSCWQESPRPHVRIELRDDGVGVRPSSFGSRVGNGLRNMQARALAIGAALEFSGCPGFGTGVLIRWPSPEQAATLDATAVGVDGPRAS